MTATAAAQPASPAPGAVYPVYLPAAAGRPAEPARAGALKPSDVAALLNVNVRKVWAWINAGRLAAVNVTPGGGRKTWRVDPADYRAFRDGLLNAKPPRRRRRVPSGGRVLDFFK